MDNQISEILSKAFSQYKPAKRVEIALTLASIYMLDGKEAFATNALFMGCNTEVTAAMLAILEKRPPTGHPWAGKLHPEHRQ